MGLHGELLGQFAVAEDLQLVVVGLHDAAGLEGLRADFIASLEPLFKQRDVDGEHGVGEGAIIRGCRVARNGQGGILLSNAHGVLISGNTVTYNAGAGGVNFSGDGGLVERNTIVGNAGGSGLSVGPTVGFVGNVLTGNGAGSSQTSGGLELGENVCGNDLVCP